MNTCTELTIADRFGLTLDGLCKAVAARIAPGIAGWAMQAATIVLIWGKLRRIEGKVQRLLARFQAGRLWVRTTPSVSRSGGGRTAKSPLKPTAKLPRLPTAKLPRRFGWLMALVPYEAACFSSQLRHLLGEPEMVALLQASPQARRVLRPLARMLGIEPALLAPPGAPVIAPVIASVIAPPAVAPRGRRMPRCFAAQDGLPSDPPPRRAGRVPRLFPPGAG